MICGGPSLAAISLDQLRDSAAARNDRAIAVNAAGHDAPWADLLIFGDSGFHARHWRMADAFPGEAWTLSREISTRFPAYGRLTSSAFGVLGKRQDILPLTGSTGQAALATAIALGARRVGLLGFDLSDQGGHYHRHYAPGEAPPLSRSARSLLRGWGRRVKALGVDVVNFSATSNTLEFPRVDVREAISERPFE